MAEVSWIVKGENVGLAAVEREEFIERWRTFNDAALAMLLTFPTTAQRMPPYSREQRERVYESIAAQRTPAFDIRLVEDGRCVGEALIHDIVWPHASGDLALAIYDSEDQGKGYGVEACELVCAYAFDGLGLNRVSMYFLAPNERMARATARHAERFGARRIGIARQAVWAFGAHRDLILVDLLRSEFPSHPATAALRLEGSGDG